MEFDLYAIFLSIYLFYKSRRTHTNHTRPNAHSSQGVTMTSNHEANILFSSSNEGNGRLRIGQAEP